MRYIAYTDGGYDMNDLVGASACVILNEEKTRILYAWAKARKCTFNPEKKARHNEQELGAVIHTVMSVPVGSRLDIYSDSQYAVNVLNGRWSATANLELIDKFHEVIGKRQIVYHLYWVRGHNGDKFNEMVDELCTNACDRLRRGEGNIYETKNLCEPE